MPSANNKSITNHRYFPYQQQQQQQQQRDKCNSTQLTPTINLANIVEEETSASECDIFIVYKRDTRNEKRNVIEKISELEKYLMRNSSKYPQLLSGENNAKKKKENLEVWATTTTTAFKDEEEGDFKYDESFRGAIQASKFIVLC